MTELTPSSDDRVVQLQLQLQASDELKNLMSELVQPSLRRDFARRVIYLALYVNPPVEVPVDVNLSDYTKGIEDVTTKSQIYTKSLHLAPEIGMYQHPDSLHGINLRFKLALTALEAGRLLAYPFDEVDADNAYLITNVPGAILGDSEMRPSVLNHMRSRLAPAASSGRQGTRALDAYYVSRPMVKKRSPSNTSV